MYAMAEKVKKEIPSGKESLGQAARRLCSQAPSHWEVVITFRKTNGSRFRAIAPAAISVRVRLAGLFVFFDPKRRAPVDQDHRHQQQNKNRFAPGVKNQRTDQQQEIAIQAGMVNKIQDQKDRKEDINES